MPSSYYKPCKELDRCLELNKYWDTDKKKWFEGYYKIANETKNYNQVIGVKKIRTFYDKR